MDQCADDDGEHQDSGDISPEWPIEEVVAHGAVGQEWEEVIQAEARIAPK